MSNPSLQSHTQESTNASSPPFEESPAKDELDVSAISTQTVPTTHTKRKLSVEPRRETKYHRSDSHIPSRTQSKSHSMLIQSSSDAGQCYDTRERPTATPWSKAVLVRIKPRADQTGQDTRYTYVSLPSLDVGSCVAAICTKLGIRFSTGMPVSWVDSKTLLRGPLNHAFLRDMPDRQDFVVTFVDVGNNRDVGLLLEM